MANIFINIPPVAAATWKDTVANAAALPPLNNTLGDVRVANDTQDIYIWNGVSWSLVASPGAATAITALIGDVSAMGPGSAPATIQPNVVTNAKLAQMGANTIKGNNTGGTANALDLTVSQVNTMLGDVTTLAAVGAVPNANAGTISGNTLTLQPANGSFPGVLLAADWTTFNNKQSSGNYITALTGDVTASGPGSAVASLTATTNSTITTLSSLALPTSQLTGRNSLTTSSANISITGGVSATVGSGNTSITLTEGNLTETVSSVLTITGGTNAVLGSGTTIRVSQATTSTSGYLSSTDWNTFNNKQTAGSYITALTGDATATGPGSVALTLATVNGNVGSFGSSTAIPNFTVNAKGLITAAGTNVVIAPAGTLTGTTLASNVVTSSLTSVGTIGTGTWQGNVIDLAHGGTNANLTAASGAVAYSTASALALSAVGSSNQVLHSNGAATPTWSAVSLTADVSGILPIANGGTGSSTQNFVDLTTTQSNIAGIKTFTSNTNIAGSAASIATIGATSSTALHQLNGGWQVTTRTITANLTVDTTTTDYIIFCNQSGAITITFPTPTNGRMIVIKDISGTAQTNNITMAQHAAEKIEGLAASKVLQTNFGSWTFTSDGTNWWMI